ncbi:MAG: AAA family ATPase [Kiritimatiellae bacterium]|nr:AAA family ATPase [Kiritimatiellia bacterium]
MSGEVNMNQTLANYVDFFNDQKNERLVEYRKLLHTPMKQLLSEDQVFYGVVHGISKERGHVVLQFNRKHSPRLKEQRTLVVIKHKARDLYGESPYVWNCSFADFLSKDELHSGSSLALPLYYLRGNNDDFVYVGCSAVDLRMFGKIGDALSAGVRIHVLLYESEPPIRYLANLVDYIEKNPEDGVLMCRPAVCYDEWKPQLLAYDPKDGEGISKTLLNALSQRNKIVLQGPPGTGKSFNAAQVIADYLSRNKSVCVAAMANKALMELILQSPLSSYLSAGKLYKTMLTSDEALTAKGLKGAGSDFIAPKGSAVFATYYKVSDQFRHIKESNGVPLYDLVVVEEASQAYLTTIAALLRLGTRCLIVGDPMQLAPIVVAENKPEYKRWNAVTQADGLTSFVLGSNVDSFRITTTFRLTPSAAELTGVFYGNTLRSVAPKTIDWSNIDNRYFPVGGGVVLEVLSGGEGAVLSPAAVKVLGNVLDKIESNCEGARVAVITPFRNSAKAIQSRFAIAGRKLDLSIETIDRVQGATVDYAILYFPLRNVSFSFDERRFNVATSRSRTTTLILSDYEMLEMRSITGKVREFLERVKGVYRDAPQDNSDAPSSVAIQPLTCERAEVSAMPTLADVQSLLDKLQARLALWLQAWLAVMYPTNLWQNAVVPNLSSLQLQNAKDNGDRRIVDLDLTALLSVFIGNFRALRTQAHIKPEMQTMAFHIKDVRHDYAHKKTTVILNVEPKTLRYHIDTMSRFLEGLSEMPPKTPPSKPPAVIKRGGITITAS